MVTVALAGISTGLGKTFLTTFLDLNARLPPPDRHTLVALTRSPRPDLVAQGVSVRPVNYTIHDQLVSALRGVHTVLPLIGGSSDIMKETQLALLAAAQEAGCTRFAPSEYAGQGYEGVDMYAGKADVFAAVAASGLEFTRFNCGLFMSVLGTGTPKARTAVGEREGCGSGEEEALAGLRRWNFVVNMKAGTVDFPGDGTAEMVLTDMRDVATYVYRALSLERWPRDLGMRGDVKSFAELVAIAERVQGRRWLKKYTPVSELEERPEDAGALFYNQTRLAFARGWGMVGGELNRTFPDVKPVDAETFIERWWSGVELGEPAWEGMHNPL